MAKAPSHPTRRRSSVPAGAAAGNAAVGVNIGGRRPGGTNARFTAQLVALVEPDRRDRVMDIVDAHGISQAAILRAIVDLGLPVVEAQIAAGELDPKKLA